MWNYVSKLEKSSGYEDVLPILKTYNRKAYNSSSDKDREKMVDEVFKIYRNKNIFPITYYNDDGIKKEIMLCHEKEIVWDSNNLDFRYNQGQSLCRFFFPNILHVECGGDKRTLYNKFYDDHMLKRAISFCLKYKKNNHPVLPTSLKDGLEMLGGGVPTNFKTMNAKAIFERYAPKDGIIYDFSSGFGGRMLGSLCSKNNYKYLGIEPNSETFDGLNKLGLSIESCLGRVNSFKILKTTSEDFSQKENYADFSFSSPPYFDLEKYSDESTQCYNKFNTLDEWFSGYVMPTVNNIYKILKPNALYAVNISDFKVGNKNIDFVNRWIEISKSSGFEFIEEITMGLQTRRGDGHNETNGVFKKEGIFIFSKTLKNK